MELKSFDTILTEMCDNFDELISPKTIARTNTNIIYLMFKAIAKGFEVINNVCVALSNKFDPANCSVEDLVSVADLVGTEKISGSATGLEITVYNAGSEATDLLKGFYYYAFDDDTTFVFEVTETVSVPALSSVSYFAFSENIGSYPVTEQTGITVTPEDGLVVSTNFTYSCADNSGLLGSVEETDVEFRNRILTNTSRQDSLVELQSTIKNLPYIYDCNIVFNNTTVETTVDGITIPPYYMAIFYSGAPRTEIAEIVAEKSIFPTVSTDDSDALIYANDVFVDSGYTVNIIPYKKLNYSIKVTYQYNTLYVATTSTEATMTASLESTFRSHIHSDFITEADIFTALKAMNLANVTFLNVDLLNEDGTSADYISVPKSRLPYLLDVTYAKVAVNG